MTLNKETMKTSLVVCSNLSDDLKKQYNKRNTGVVKGDTVKIVRGEYKGVEGKVEKINTEKGKLSIEGVQREKIKGGNVKVLIHASNVIISSLNMDDKYRKNRMENKDRQINKSKRPDIKKKEKK
ncbi:MAG TPA: 50S ribosomal protein L24 [Candidatus Nitrosocosmicus sp.]|nr:50S ribosomal protein L24 [Candidatus Nitrosocosmicus sp.]